jgi:hypothetical protein
LHEKLLELFGASGLTCVLENESSVLTREPGSPSRQPGDEIALQTRSPADPGAGWIEVNVPDKITQEDSAIRLSIHHWEGIARRVGGESSGATWI